MVFNSDIFLFGFLPAVVLGFLLLKDLQARYFLLTVASFAFYGYWDWRFCGLLLASTLLSYWVGGRIVATSRPRTARSWMLLAVVVDLSLLGFFKYYDFLAVNVDALVPGALPVLGIVLPIGISFYTFHTISYVVDVAAGRIPPARNLLEYSTYVTFFPQLVAGPIVRYRQVRRDLVRLDQAPYLGWAHLALGFFVVGLVKKVAVADSLAAYVDPLLAYPDRLTLVQAWMAALGYAFQIYYDFSGYSDMAVGLGLLFGVRLPQNFNAPYRADGPRDFWHRWHISLSTWLRDYLYIPLGGSRTSPLRTEVNLMATMLLGGLWHGAGWNFILWGAYHGALLVLERRFQDAWLAVPALVRRATTFLLILFSWVLFRSLDLAMVGQWLSAMFAGPLSGSGSFPAALAALNLACLVAVQALPETWDIRFRPTGAWAAWLTLGLLVGYLFMRGNETVFLYYQF